MDLDYKDKEGLTALHHAVLHGFEDTTEVLIDDGSDVNCSSNVHGTPLCLAALKARNNVIRLLLKARASLSARESHLGSALHYACISGEATTVELLLDAGAEPNGRAAMHMPGTTCCLAFPEAGTKSNNTCKEGSANLWLLAPLDVALYCKNSVIPSILLQRGAALNLSGMPVEIYQTHQRQDTGLLVLPKTRCCGPKKKRSLFSAGVPSCSKSDVTCGLTALMLASERGNSRCIARLLDLVAQVNAQTFHGATALLLAVSKGHADCVRLLLAGGAHIEAENEHRKTALMYAVENGTHEIVKVLLRAGANPNNVGAGGCCNPLDVATNQSFIGIHGNRIAGELARHSGKMFPPGSNMEFEDRRTLYIRLFSTRTLDFERFALEESNEIRIPCWKFHHPKYIVISQTCKEGDLDYQAILGVSVAQRSFSQSFDPSVQLGHKRLMDFIQKARDRNIAWIWSQSLCVDRAKSAERDEAMQFSALWHRWAEQHLVYLDNVFLEATQADVCTAKLKQCSWLTCLWNLPGLLGCRPHENWFFDCAWNCIGSLVSLAPVLSEVTGIHPAALKCFDRLYFGDIERSNMSFSKPEDPVYVFSNIQGLPVRLKYGEGDFRAWKKVSHLIHQRNLRIMSL